MTGNGEAAGTTSLPSILTAQELCKSYGPRQALRGLSFSLGAGRVLGFLGPNGAGKTTAIRILTTILEPDSGRFAVGGVGCEHPQEIRRRIGVLPESFGLPKQMTGVEYVTFFGQLYGRGAADARSHGQALLEQVGLQKRAKSLVGSYSHGMRQRLGIARALVNDPVVVFLDEPTLGLDPRSQQELHGLVRRIARERQAGVVLCSHLLSEVEKVCDDVVILSSGQIVASGSVADVIGGAQSRGGQAGSVRISVPPATLDPAQRILEALPSVARVAATNGDAVGRLRVELSDDAARDQAINNALLAALIRAEIPVLGFEAEGTRLEDVFLQLTDRSIR
jgi:ABC-2 type transport system ATP-binding protein